MSLDGILVSIAAGLAAAVPALEVCSPIGGNVDLGEVLRRSTQLPAAFVFCVGTDDAIVLLDKVRTTATFAAVLVTKSANEQPPVKNDRASVAARLAGRLLYNVATAKVWGNDEVASAPTNIDSRNRYSTAGDKAGIAIWAVSWDQQIWLAQDPAPGDLDDLVTIKATYELQDGTTPAIDAEDEIHP